MIAHGARLTYIGGPTALLEVGGLRLLTDPTFDPAGAEYRTAIYTLRKTEGPAIPAADIGVIDAVLLSHDHHFDNLDAAGRRLLAAARRTLTTVVGAGRLGGTAIGLAPWQAHDLPLPDGGTLRITATPARHGPADGDRGPCNGFLLQRRDAERPVIYVSGDTVWFEGMAEVARRFTPDVAFLFMGAARVKEVGPAHLTLTAEEAVTAARAMPTARIVPLHAEGWAHFSESREVVDRAFAEAGLAGRLAWPPAGTPVEL